MLHFITQKGFLIIRRRNKTMKYLVTVELSCTKSYYVDAGTEKEAREKYLLDGLTSTLYETEIDRKVINVEEVKDKNNDVRL
tara:strand:- start:133 stop:378 length:246 start_codon:yes stop_codon:yes gene_type:complete